MKCSLFLLFLVVLDLCVYATFKKVKSVTTLLDAKWEATPLVLEVAEFLSAENGDYYWNFIDSINTLTPPLSEIENDKKRYDLIITEAKKLLSPSQLSILKLSLSLHIFSPKVQMFMQIASERDLPPCSSVVDVNGQLTCDLNQVDTLINNIESEEVTKHIDIFSVDNHYPGSENRSLPVIFYGEIGSSEFSKFHTYLKNKAIEGSIDYIVRHYIRKHSGKKLRLSGYGVELQLKSTEYKAQDDSQVKVDGKSEETSQEDEEAEIDGFDFAKLRKRFPDLQTNLERFKQHLEDTSDELAPLKVWQFQELSLQAAERIMNAPQNEALKVFTNIAQNFPLQAKSLIKTVVNPEMRREMKANSEIFASTLNLQPSDTALFINGMFYDLDVVDIYGIVDILHQDLKIMEKLHSMEISNKNMNRLLSLDFGANSDVQEFALDVRDSSVNWINDIETDAKYSRWGSSLLELLRPTFPGMIRQIRRNLYNLVFIIDPTDPNAKDILKIIESFVTYTAPIHIGLVLKVNPSKLATGLTDMSVAIQNIFNYMLQKKDAISAVQVIHNIVADMDTDEFDIEIIKRHLGKVDIEEILGEDSDFDFGRQLANDFIQRSGFKTFPQALLNGIPIAQNKINAEDFEEAVLQEIMSQTTTIQKAVYHGKLSDKDDILEYLMTQPHVMPRLNQRILTNEGRFYLDTSGKAITTTNVQNLLKLSPRDMTATAIENLKYFTGRKKVKSNDLITYWIIGDLENSESRFLLLNALEHLTMEIDVRVSFLPNVNGNKENKLNKVVLAALQELPSEKAASFALSLLRHYTSTNSLENFSIPLAIQSKIPAQELNLKMLRVYCQRVLNLSEGQKAVVANGRVLGPLDEGEIFSLEDFSLLDRYMAVSYLEKIKEALSKEKDEEDSDITSNTFFKIIPLLVSRTQHKPRFEVTFSGNQYSVIKIPPAKSHEVAFDLVAIVDPVSRGAQKLGTILQVLQDVLNCNIQIFLNCIEKNSDMPLKSFYRFVLEPEIQFSEDGKQSLGPIGKFNNMPSSPLLTQNYHVPENWLVEVVRSVYDLDNIRLENVESNVHSEYELEYLLLEGHCFEQRTGSPPRGLQITLGTVKQPVIVDTIVMANLGYFQLKANPGAWIFRLRQGRSAEIYDIASHDGTDTPENSTDIKVLINSLRSHIVKLKVQKRPDKWHMDLLSEDDDNNGGIWNSITSSFTGNDESSDERLNIFSVASGHLYERFLRIMMLSVLKHTTTPVKFWFLKTYLSPQIKDFLPYMAKKYGFEYELVQYKWPRWLHQQTEKQRIIWGYKILFLDVLFPLDVKKIIFVDADQVVRADLTELRDFDLGNAPYGYTPFCESRKEMEGFRFWKHGYWRNHLQGRKYHISALYVVDLKRFRRIAAGDRLRGQYQALSQDPNSLSNLDQDLPNNMIHQVSIKSLPQEWLWCETWCDEASKEQAKTIDLCNNPMTKEAKLTAAVRILPEWKSYDEEIRVLQKMIDTGLLDADPAMDSNNDFKEYDKDIHTEL